ncbi:MAG: type II 3-dehydroquinate dehydratase [Elusimicrobiota bacterium]
MNILILHGPNLNLLGEREKKIYGTMTLARLNRMLRAEAKRLKITVKIFQKNGEGELLDLMHRHRRWADGILINPAAYTHYSYALRDGLASLDRPAVEVHLSDIRKREAWRRKSVTEPVCAGQFVGKGAVSYLEGLRALREIIRG